MEDNIIPFKPREKLEELPLEERFHGALAEVFIWHYEDEIYVCECGNTLFFLTKTGYLCPSCGRN